MPLPADFRERLVSELAKRGVDATCEVCGHNNWAVLDQALSIQITDLSGNVRIPSPQVPSAGLICNNCGNFRLFVLGVLGLLPEQMEDGAE